MRPLPRLMIITDWSLGPALVECIRSLVALGPRLAIQHRHPEAPVRAFVEEARLLAALCRPHDVPLFVNGRLDVALGVKAHLHLPSDGVTPADARPHLPPGRWVSCAVHSVAEAASAGRADLALVSPVFVPLSKKDDSRTPLGCEGFLTLARALSCPAYALGGVTPKSAPLLPGMRGAAAVSGVLRAANPRVAAESILDTLHV